jgi:hypothetical protein
VAETRLTAAALAAVLSPGGALCARTEHADERSKVRELQVSPNLEIALPANTYLSFFPSADIRYNFVRNEAFLPVDIEIGTEWRDLVFSIEAAKAVVKADHPPYGWRVETRIGLRF